MRISYFVGTAASLLALSLLGACSDGNQSELLLVDSKDANSPFQQEAACGKISDPWSGVDKGGYQWALISSIRDQEGLLDAPNSNRAKDLKCQPRKNDMELDCLWDTRQYEAPRDLSFMANEQRSLVNYYSDREAEIMGEIAAIRYVGETLETSPEGENTWTLWFQSDLQRQRGTTIRYVLQYPQESVSDRCGRDITVRLITNIGNSINWKTSDSLQK